MPETLAPLDTSKASTAEPLCNVELERNKRSEKFRFKANQCYIQSVKEVKKGCTWMPQEPPLQPKRVVESTAISSGSVSIALRLEDRHVVFNSEIQGNPSDSHEETNDSRSLAWHFPVREWNQHERVCIRIRY